MSGWVWRDDDCEVCQNSGFVTKELEPWRKVALAIVECPECYPEFLKIVRCERQTCCKCPSESKRINNCHCGCHEHFRVRGTTSIWTRQRESVEVSEVPSSSVSKLPDTGIAQ